ncbi:sugar ABC transporter substrate-binding protein [Leifsonia poae]|uniref:sugar ABC transporter substrate-binding protein n=1 Tax=Leifsonia poae TaxID=110933 RepID=UPI001CBEE8DE|nr:extracellular solute-binding protein [Leifsonia poae]
MFDKHSRSRRGRQVARIVAFAAIASLSVSGLAACSSGGNAAGGDKTVSFWHYYAQGIPATKKFTADLTSIVAKQNPGITLDPVFVPTEQLTQKVIASAASKKGPDTFVEDGSDLPQLVKAGALADFTKQFDAFKDKDQFPESVVTRIDGKVYGVKGFMNGVGLWYNQDILDEFGLTPPTTMDELNADLATIGTKYIGLGVAGQGQQDGDAFPFITAYGFDYKKPSAKPLEKAFSMVGDWAHKGYIPQDAATWTGDVVFQKFLTGTMAFAVGGNWQYGNAKATAKFKYGAVPMPSGTQPAQVYQFGDYAYMGAFTKDKDTAFKAIASMFLSKEGEMAAFAAGSLPTRKDLADEPALKSDPVFSSFLKGLQNSVPYLIPGFGTELTQMREPVGQAWGSVIAQQKSAADAAKGAIDAIDRVKK